MKQWRIDGEWSFDGLGLVEASVPDPGPGEVLLRMKAVSLNYRDHVMVGRGYGRLSGELPLVPLSDGVGEVVALGDGVGDIAIGSRRLPCFNQGWSDGDFEDSMWAEMLGPGALVERLFKEGPCDRQVALHADRENLAVVAPGDLVAGVDILQRL